MTPRLRALRYAIDADKPLTGSDVEELMDERDRLAEALAWLIEEYGGDVLVLPMVPRRHTHAVADALRRGDWMRGDTGDN